MKDILKELLDLDNMKNKDYKHYMLKKFRKDYYYSKQKAPKVKARIRRALKKKTIREMLKDLSNS